LDFDLDGEREKDGNDDGADDHPSSASMQSRYNRTHDINRSNAQNSCPFKAIGIDASTIYLGARDRLFGESLLRRHESNQALSSQANLKIIVHHLAWMSSHAETVLTHPIHAASSQTCEVQWIQASGKDKKTLASCLKTTCFKTDLLGA